MSSGSELPEGVRDWLALAEQDWNRVANRLAEHDVGDAAFHPQQAIEKYLKAFLIARGWRLRRIHDLETLLDEALPYEPNWERFRDLCQQVSGFYLIGRYPLPAPPPTDEEVQECLDRSAELVAEITDRLT